MRLTLSRDATFIQQTLQCLGDQGRCRLQVNDVHDGLMCVRLCGLLFHLSTARLTGLTASTGMNMYALRCCNCVCNELGFACSHI